MGTKSYLVTESIEVLPRDRRLQTRVPSMQFRVYDKAVCSEEQDVDGHFRKI
jgi:hypothetical protein